MIEIESCRSRLGHKLILRANPRHESTLNESAHVGVYDTAAGLVS